MRRLLLLPAATLVVLTAPTFAATGPELEPPTTERVALTSPTEIAGPGWSKRAKVPADLVGVIWRGDQHAEFHVEVRHGTGPWEEVGHVEREAAAEPGSEEAASVAARGAELASAPIWVDDATAVRVRLEGGDVRRVSLAAVQTPEPEALSGLAGAIGGWVPTDGGPGQLVFGIVVLAIAILLTAIALGMQPLRVVSRLGRAVVVTALVVAALAPTVVDERPADAWILTPPPITARSWWGSDLAWNPACTAGVQYAASLKFAVVHHTATGNTYSAGDTRNILRSIWGYHVGTLGYCDIAYNFLVDRFGKIIEGRTGGIDRPVIAGHTGGFNTSSTGISVIGDFTSAPPSSAVIAAVDDLMAWKLSVHGVNPGQGFSTTSNGGGSYWPAGTPVSFATPILAHRDLWPTACNGNAFYNLLPSMRADVINRVGPAGSIPGPTSSEGQYVPLTPARLLDTRRMGTVDGLFAGVGSLSGGQTLSLQVAGRGGVPNEGVGAVVLNVTVTQPTGIGHVITYGTGSPKPNTSNLNFVPGQTVANLVITKVGTNGQVTLFNSTGSTHLVVDVVGWFPSGGEYGALTPARVLDTRVGMATVDGLFAGVGSLSGGQTLSLQVAGRGGVPNEGVGAVVLNVTVTQPTGIGHVITYGTGSPKPNTSNLNFVPGQTVANLVITKVGTNGQVTLFNSTGSTHLVVDVVGWFPSG